MGGRGGGVLAAPPPTRAASEVERCLLPRRPARELHCIGPLLPASVPRNGRNGDSRRV